MNNFKLAVAIREHKIFIIMLTIVITLLTLKSLTPIIMPEKNGLTPPSLPLLLNTQNNNLLEKLLARNLWSKNGEQLHANLVTTTNDQLEIAESPQLADNNWQLRAIFLHNNQYIAVIQDSNAVVSNYQLHQQLPDGSKLINITPSAIQTLNSGITNDVFLFGKK